MLVILRFIAHFHCPVTTSCAARDLIRTNCWASSISQRRCYAQLRVRQCACNPILPHPFHAVAGACFPQLRNLSMEASPQTPHQPNDALDYRTVAALQGSHSWRCCAAREVLVRQPLWTAAIIVSLVAGTMFLFAGELITERASATAYL
jgi:hypothetical protein